MALSQEEITAARAKLGIPSAGVSATNNTANRVDELDAAWSGGNTQREYQSGLPGLVKNVKEDFDTRKEKVEAAKTKTKEGKQSMVSTIFQTLGQGAGLVGDIGFDVLKSVFKPEIRKGVDDFTAATVKKIIQTPVVEDQIKHYKSFKENHPELAGNLEAALNIVSVLPIGKGAALGVKAGERALKATTKVGKTVEEGAQVGLKNESKQFVKDLVTPEQTKAVKEAQVGRTTETGTGPFKKSVIEPSKEEANAAKYVEKVPDLNPKGTLQQNYNIIKKENQAEAKRLAETLAANDFAYPRKELLARLKGTKEELARNPVITGDAEKTADKLIAEIERRISESKAKGSNLLQVRKDFDAWVEAQKGSAVFDPAKESALSVSTRSIRRAINNFLDEKAPNAGVKDSLRKQSALYDAMDNIAPKAAKEADSAMGRFFQKMDTVLGTKNKAVQILAATVGIGGLGAASTFAPAVAAGGIGGYLLYKGGKLVLSPKARSAIGGVIKELENVRGAKGAAKAAGAVAGGSTASAATELIDELTTFLADYGDDEGDDGEGK
jgi:hypothetical protein